MSLDDVVNVQITIQSSALSLPGFGKPLLLDEHSNFAERIRYYSDTQGLLDDGFISTDPIFRMATVIFSQNPKPSQIAVGRSETPGASVDTILVAAAPDGTYTVQVNGKDASFVAVGSTVTLIRDGLVAAINALVFDVGDTDVTAAPVSTDALTVTSDTAGITVFLSLAAPVTGDLVFRQNVDVTGNDAGDYTITIGTVAHTFTADGVILAAAIRDGLVSLINAGTSGVTAAPGAGDDLDLTNSGQFVVEVAAILDNLAATERTLNIGIPEDLIAISDENEDWYLLLLPERDDQTILTAARAIESVRKTYLAQSSDETIVSTVFDSGNVQDIASRLKALNLARTGVVFTRSDINDVAAGWAGLQLPKTPASSTWKFKTVRAVSVDTFTTTQLNNLKSKDANGYRDVAGKSMMFEGTVAQGEFLDVVRGVDKLFQTIQAFTFGALIRNEKIPFTDSGIAVIADQVTAALLESVAEGLIANSRENDLTGDLETPAFTVTAPRAISINAADRENRIIPANNPITFEGTLAGAIHTVNVRGTLSV